jgi:hypothetical protein
MSKKGLPIVFRAPSAQSPRSGAPAMSPAPLEPDPGRKPPAPTDEQIIAFVSDVKARGLELDPRLVASHFQNAGYEAGIHEMGLAIRRLRAEGRIE